MLTPSKMRCLRFMLMLLLYQEKVRDSSTGDCQDAGPAPVASDVWLFAAPACPAIWFAPAPANRRPEKHPAASAPKPTVRIRAVNRTIAAAAMAARQYRD